MKRGLEQEISDLLKQKWHFMLLPHSDDKVNVLKEVGGKIEEKEVELKELIDSRKRKGDADVDKTPKSGSKTSRYGC
jgi:hypothetical protein